MEGHWMRCRTGSKSHFVPQEGIDNLDYKAVCGRDAPFQIIVDSDDWTVEGSCAICRLALDTTYAEGDQ